MVSDTTLIFMPANGLAASWNHFSSATCWSWLSVLGESSGSHFSIAAARSTGAEPAPEPAEPPDAGPAPLPALPLPPVSAGCFLLQLPADSAAAVTATHHHALRDC